MGKMNAFMRAKEKARKSGASSFKYKGKLYKYTGAFAPANQILGMLKFV